MRQVASRGFLSSYRDAQGKKIRVPAGGERAGADQSAEGALIWAYWERR